MMKVGVLGAAQVTGDVLVRPATVLEGVEVVAIAARERGRAEEAAREHGIPRVLESYDAVLADPEIDAVYIPLPIALHGRWTLAAIDAGKHVLCEKTLAANAVEAQAVAARARVSGVVVMEAHHTSHHPQTKRAAEIVRSGMLGELHSAESTFVVRIPPDGIQWDLGLAGGALMDLGCYPVRWLRDVLEVAPIVTSAIATDQAGIDVSSLALLDYAGVPGRIHAAMVTAGPPMMEAEVRGSRGTMTVQMPFHPHMKGTIAVEGPAIRIREQADSESSYLSQLHAFRDAVLGRGENITHSDAAVETMQTIDDIYYAAGMDPRQPAN